MNIEIEQNSYSTLNIGVAVSSKQFWVEKHRLHVFRICLMLTWVSRLFVRIRVFHVYVYIWRIHPVYIWSIFWIGTVKRRCVRVYVCIRHCAHVFVKFEIVYYCQYLHTHRAHIHAHRTNIIIRMRWWFFLYWICRHRREINSTRFPYQKHYTYYIRTT